MLPAARFVGAAVVAALAGCSSPSSNALPPLGHAPTYVVVNANDGATFVGSVPIGIQIGQGLDFVTIDYAGYNTKDSSEFFSGTVYVANASVTDTDYEAELSFTPEAAGKAHITRGVDAATATVATAGTIKVHRDAATHEMTATIESPDERLAGTFSGEYVVTCLVPPADLGQPNTGPGVLVMDSSFSTAFCRQFASLP